jgi:hypothetical protein
MLLRRLSDANDPYNNAVDLIATASCEMDIPNRYVTPNKTGLRKQRDFHIHVTDKY